MDLAKAEAHCEEACAEVHITEMYQAKAQAEANHPRCLIGACSRPLAVLRCCVDCKLWACDRCIENVKDYGLVCGNCWVTVHDWD